MMNASHNPAFSQPVDAVVLAGTDSNPKRMIEGKNKSFLEVGGKVLVSRVVEELLAAPGVGNIFVVGPTARLRETLSGLPADVIIVEQSGSMLSNIWAAVYAADTLHRELTGEDDPTRPMLIISSDLPLVSHEAVQDFIRRCAREEDRLSTKFGMMAGVAEEVSLRPFYPEQAKIGIHRPYVNYSDCRIRLANIYIGRPHILKNHQFLETGFAHRKAEKVKNVVLLAWNFLSQRGGFRAAWITLRLQLTLMASKKKGWWYRWLKAGNKLTDTEKTSGDVLGGAVRIVIIPYGGLSLDVDNDEDYRVLSERYSEWARIGPVEPPG